MVTSSGLFSSSYRNHLNIRDTHSIRFSPPPLLHTSYKSPIFGHQYNATENRISKTMTSEFCCEICEIWSVIQNCCNPRCMKSFRELEITLGCSRNSSELICSKGNAEASRYGGEKPLKNMFLSGGISSRRNVQGSTLTVSIQKRWSLMNFEGASINYYERHQLEVQHSPHEGRKFGPSSENQHLVLYTMFTLRVSIKICLLYTSPSPRDRTRSRMPSSA